MPFVNLPPLIVARNMHQMLIAIEVPEVLPFHVQKIQANNAIIAFHIFQKRWILVKFDDFVFNYRKLLQSLNGNFLLSSSFFSVSANPLIWDHYENKEATKHKKEIPMRLGYALSGIVSPKVFLTILTVAFIGAFKTEIPTIRANTSFKVIEKVLGAIIAVIEFWTPNWAKINVRIIVIINI